MKKLKRIEIAIVTGSGLSSVKNILTNPVLSNIQIYLVILILQSKVMMVVFLFWKL